MSAPNNNNPFGTGPRINRGTYKPGQEMPKINVQQYQGNPFGGGLQARTRGGNPNVMGAANNLLRGDVQFSQAGGQTGGRTTLDPNKVPPYRDLQPFMDSGGNVKYDPYTGNKAGKRKTPGQIRSEQTSNVSTGLAQGPALQEASNFQFQNLPETQGYMNQLQGATQNVMGTSGQNLGAGMQNTQDAVGNILSTQDRMGAFADQSGAAKEQARQELGDLQRQALSPDLDPMQRAFFQQRADERLAEVNNIEGGLVDAFQRQRASDAAQLAARGVLDSGTASNVMGERERRLGLDINQLQREAGEISRQEMGKEREGIRGAAGQFGGIQSGQALGEGNLVAQLLGSRGQLGGTLGQLGLGQGGIGAELAKYGIGGMSELGQLGLASRGQEADLQQAELSTRLMGDQTQLNNLQALENQEFARAAARKGLGYQQELFDQMQKDRNKVFGIF